MRRPTSPGSAGSTDFGRTVVADVQRLGMLMRLSHATPVLPALR
jgi:microsomal dipeptidase-like Zn-dependent dipeptidase